MPTRVIAPASVRSGSLTFVGPRRASTASIAPVASEPMATSRLGRSAGYPAALPTQPSGLGGFTAVTSSPPIYRVAPPRASQASVIMEPAATGAQMEPVVTPMTPTAASVTPVYAPAPVQGACTPIGSYAPAPVTPPLPSPAPVSVLDLPPEPPQPLTTGFPDPVAIERQKAAYARGLNEQLQHGTEVLAQQLKQQSDYLFSMGDQQKRQYELQVNQHIKQQELALAQQHNEQLLMLQHAAQQQKAALEHQSNALILEYNQRKAHEDIRNQQYQFAKQHHEMQAKYDEEMRQIQEQQAQHAAQHSAQQAMHAQQAAATAYVAPTQCPTPMASYSPPPQQVSAPLQTAMPPPTAVYASAPATCYGGQTPPAVLTPSNGASGMVTQSVVLQPTVAHYGAMPGSAPGSVSTPMEPVAYTT